MTKRYFASELPAAGGSVELAPNEAQHAIRVMRVQEGDQVELFDGRGRQCHATVKKLGRQFCECVAEPTEQLSREPTVSLHLGIALPKPDRAKELVERLTELGVQKVTPLVADRTQREPSDSLLDKLSKVVIEACKQSGRNDLLTIASTMGAKEFFQTQIDQPRLIAHPAPDAVSVDSRPVSTCYSVAIGPEGGWTDQEFLIAKEHGFIALNLGSRIYRVETAAVAIAACLVS